MKKKIIFICRSSSIYFVPENLIPLNFIKLGYEVIEIKFDKMSYADVEKTLYLNNDADYIFTYGRGCFPALFFILKHIYIPKIIWMPSIITDSPNAMDIVRNYLSCYDIVYTTLPTEITLYKKLGINAKPLFSAIHEDFYKSLDIEKDIEIGFFGRMHYNSRKKLVDFVSEKYNIYSEFSETKYIELINRTKINLNVGYFDFGLPNRVFDTLGCGGFLLTQKYINEDNILEDGKHLVYFTYSDIYDKIKYYLDYPEERKKIAKQGQDEVLKKHTYKNRIEIINKDLNFII